MQILSQLEQFLPTSSGPISLSLGNFDGVHLGHQSLIKKLCSFAVNSVLITFSNHPSSILKGFTPLLLTSYEHKLNLITNLGVKTTIGLPFTKELSLKKAGEFLQEIRTFIPFSHLILGHDAQFGRDRDGTWETLSLLSKKMDFFLEYIDPILIEGIPISSSRIRTAIEKGDLSQAKILLDRPFSIYGEVIPGRGLGATIGFPTANINPFGLVLPPFGVYFVTAKVGNSSFPAIANLGTAPTIAQENPSPLLEVHLLQTDQDLYKKKITINFEAFIREERKFPSILALKQQIQQDIAFINKNI